MNWHNVYLVICRTKVIFVRTTADSVQHIKKIQIFLHDRPWISPWIQLTYNELNITVHVITSQFSSYCDVPNKRFWRHQQNVNPAIEARGRCVKIVVFIVIFIVVMSCKKYNDVLLEWQTVSAFTRVLLWCLFAELRSTETVCHSSTHIILNFSHIKHIHLHTLRWVHSTLQIYWKNRVNYICTLVYCSILARMLLVYSDKDNSLCMSLAAINRVTDQQHAMCVSKTYV